MIRVCSGFSPAGRIQYGERFLKSFDRFWPQSVELVVYVEEPTTMPRNAERSLWSIPGALQFHHRHKDDLVVHGRVPNSRWKQREREAGYSFKFDAMKFWKQIMIPQAAMFDGAHSFMSEGDILVWLDGDVETIAAVPEDLIPNLLGSAEVVFLGREPKHSEIGFWAVRVNEKTAIFLNDIAAMYRHDAVFNLPEWHSAFVWDHVRRQTGMRESNLSAGKHGHVWPNTRLGGYMRHDKGARKPK